MRLVHKLTVSLVVGIGVIFGIDAWIHTRTYVQLYEEDVKRDGLVMGRTLAAVVARVWDERGEAEAIALVQRTNEQENEVRIRWVALDAAPDAPDAPDLGPEPLAPLRRGLQVSHLDPVRDGHGRLYTYTPVEIAGQPLRALELSESLAFERHFLAQRLRLKLVTAAAMFLLGALLAWQLGLRLVGRPVRSLVEKARRIGAGDFTTPLRLSQRDELGDLSSEMNAMAEQLELASRKAASEAAARVAAVEQLRHADRLTTVGQLASGIAHELGTPLNVVSGRAQMIASGEVGDAAEACRIIVEQAERMTRIVRQLLDFARRRNPEKRRTDLAGILRQTAALLAPLAARRSVTLETPDSSQACSAEVDASQLQQALTNLVMNAVQATPPCGRVTLRLGRSRLAPPAKGGSSEEDCAWIEVRDSGDGIPPERLLKVFDPFFTTKPVGEGTGLGLSVAYGIVTEHGGWIDVKSRPGEGSCFRICVPQGGAVERPNPDRR